MGLASRSCEGVAVIWTRKVEFFVSGPHLKLVRKSFFGDRSPNFGWKNRFNFGEELSFFLELFPASKKAPPFANSWQRACFPVYL